MSMLLVQHQFQQGIHICQQDCSIFLALFLGLEQYLDSQKEENRQIFSWHPAEYRKSITCFIPVLSTFCQRNSSRAFCEGGLKVLPLSATHNGQSGPMEG